jgi:hypothetical protein
MKQKGIMFYKLVALFFIVISISCSINDPEKIVDRTYTISLISDNQIVIDSIQCEIKINGEALDSLSFYRSGLAPALAENRIITLKVNDPAESHDYVNNAVLTIRGNRSDSVEISYRAWSKGLPVLYCNKPFILTQESPIVGTTRIDKKALDFVKSLGNSDLSIAEGCLAFETRIAEAMCVNFNDGSYYNLYEKRDACRDSKPDTVFGAVMECMFSLSFNVATLNGVNKNIPDTIDVDSHFKEKFYSGEYMYEDFISTSLWQIVPEKALIDSVINARSQ